MLKIEKIREDEYLVSDNKNSDRMYVCSLNDVMTLLSIPEDKADLLKLGFNNYDTKNIK